MGFIERMLGVRDEAPAETEPETAELQPDTQQDGTEGAEAQPQSYTQDELDFLISEKKKEWLEEVRAEEQARINQLPEEERQKREEISKDDEISRLKAEIAKRDMQEKVLAALEEKQLPVGIAKLVQYGDEESTMKSLDAVIDVFSSAVQEGVRQRLRGRTPEGLGAASVLNSTKDPFAQAFTKALK